MMPNGLEWNIGGLSLRQIKSPASRGAFYLAKCTGFGENPRFDRSAGADLDVATGNARRVSARDGANQSLLRTSASLDNNERGLDVFWLPNP